jgi:hypothetical protein
MEQSGQQRPDSGPPLAANWRADLPARNGRTVLE